MITSTDGLVTVTPPQGAGWLIEQTAGAGQGDTRATLIKCKRAAPEFFFMMAKDYTVPPVHVVTPERLLREIFPTHYGKMFTQVKIDVVRELERGWWEAGYQFVHAKLGAIAKLERVICVDNHILLVSGEGAQNDVRTHFAALTEWMGGAAFATLG